MAAWPADVHRSTAAAAQARVAVVRRRPVRAPVVLLPSEVGPPQAVAAIPQPAALSAIDPIALEPADEIVITTLADNVYDAVLTDDRRTTRAPFSIGPAQAPQFEAGSTTGGLMAEHGFSALGSVRRGTTTTTLLVDTGLSRGAMITNAGRPGADLSQIQAAAPATATSTRPAAWPVSPGRRGPGRCR